MSEKVTIGRLREILDEVVNAGLATDDMVVAVAKDPEGNGFSLLDEDGLFAFGTVQDIDGPNQSYEGKRVAVIWPSYPQFEEVG